MSLWSGRQEREGGREGGRERRRRKTEKGQNITFQFFPPPRIIPTELQNGKHMLVSTTRSTTTTTGRHRSPPVCPCPGPSFLGLVCGGGVCLMDALTEGDVRPPSLTERQRPGPRRLLYSAYALRLLVSRTPPPPRKNSFHLYFFLSLW